MMIAIVAIIIGLIVLVWSADAFIEGATEVAVKFNMPSFLIGVLILGVGTSAPEMVVSALSALDGSPGLALGNAFGSNIMNIALVLALTAIICPIAIERNVLKHDMMLLLAATGLIAYQLSDLSLTFNEGVVMILTLVGILILQTVLSLKNNISSEELDIDVNENDIDIKKSWGTLLLGLVLLLASSKAIVYGAVELARFWGMSELVIGLTIVAIGTSLPELVASITAARKGDSDMALGNIVGSNLFNTLGVVGLATVISPLTSIESLVFSRDMFVVGLMTAALFIICLIAIVRKQKMYRISGAILLTSFIGYTLMLVQTA